MKGSDAVTKVLLTREVRLERINQQYADLPDLHMLKYRNRMVAGGGSSSPRILFIGDIPGAEEARSGLSLCGNRKHFVLCQLRGIDLREEHMHVTYLLKYRPPQPRDPRSVEAEVALPLLLEEIDVLKPDLIVSWGRSVLDALAPGQRLGQVHGEHIVSDHGFMFVPMYSLDAAMGNQSVRLEMQADFDKIRSLV